jgi:RNA polymerase sigma-70 factor (ECF subfamily)
MANEALPAGTGGNGHSGGSDPVPPAVPPDLVPVIAEHHAAIYRYAFRLTGLSADAEDLTQQTFLVAHQRLGQVRDLGRVRGWLFAVLRSCFLKSCRKRLPVPEANVDVDLDKFPEELPQPEEFDPERLQAAIDDLPDKFRLVVLMFYYEGLSYKEIAEALHVPMGTVMSQLSRAKGHLRRRLLAAEPKPAHVSRGARVVAAGTGARAGRGSR